VGVAAASLGSTGCVFSDAEIHPPGYSPTPLGVGRGRQLVLESPFVEGRRTLGRCGMKKNGWGSGTADVLCTEAPGAWVAGELHKAFTLAGFQVLRPGDATSEDTIVLTGRITQFFVEPKLSFWGIDQMEADIGVEIEARSQSGLVARRVFYVKGMSDSALSLESDFQEAASDATAKLVPLVVLSVARLADRYPGLGGPAAPPVAAPPAALPGVPL